MFVIRNRWAKVGLVVAVFVVVSLIGRLLGAIPGPTGAIVVAVLHCLGVLALTRVFRGPGEPDAPRPGWRMTATSRWSYGLGTLWLVSAFLGVVTAVTGPLLGTSAGTAASMDISTPAYFVVLCVEIVGQVLLLVLFVRSGRRLRALGQAAPARPTGAGPRLPS